MIPSMYTVSVDWYVFVDSHKLNFRDMKDMKANQAKAAVETSKDVNNDKTLKTKADRDRRLKEKNQNNTKRFIEERKIHAMKQGKQKEKLKKIHDQQQKELSKDIQMVCSHYVICLS